MDQIEPFLTFRLSEAPHLFHKDLMHFNCKHRLLKRLVFIRWISSPLFGLSKLISHNFPVLLFSMVIMT
jgi:hypothetical protein